MENLPAYISFFFAGTTLLTLWLLYRAANRSKAIIILGISWLALQSILGLAQFYTNTNALPPRFVFLVLPPLIGIILLFSTNKGQHFLASLQLKWLTLLHVVRIPVEVTLFSLALHQMVPTLMTFEGRNLDTISGLTAPLVYYFGLLKNRLSPKLLLIWNFICLGLLLNIVVNAILSVPTPFQKFAFDQPNIALLYFPFVWLPSVIVPAVLLAHLTSIRKLIILSKKTTPVSFNQSLP
ncbi:hypothetical protein AHMF7605_23165 [Adhaeribacter arboris]|uniref:Uncharacterized protein n=1 Tax=Adhaeribacter arboris TaxID=2072846 RepID=A0A2T2YKZ8_9BACT|nr:hypothetical protein [Adhaeribacter arboris]PSR56196.1 hypothetical protein AHMF7605_23165 [Adhaeribacter arboris]